MHDSSIDPSSLDPSAPPEQTNGSSPPRTQFSVLKRPNGSSSPRTHSPVLKQPNGSSSPRTHLDIEELLGLELIQNAEHRLNRQITAEDVSEIFVLGLRSWVARMERRASATPKLRARCARRASARGIPGWIRSAVWERDGGQCTFVGTTGHRCTDRRLLEFGQVDGGDKTKVENLRLLCRVHFKYEASRARNMAQEE